MSTYAPDRWVLVKAISDKGKHYRVVATFYGGYLGADAWKISSGIANAKYENDMWILPQVSGSVYECREGAYGMGLYTSMVLGECIERLGVAGCEMTILDEADADDVLLAGVFE